MGLLLFTCASVLAGLVVGRWAATAVERLPFEDEFHRQLFEDGESRDEHSEWWRRLPFIYFFTRHPFDHPLAWYDKVPLLPYFVYAWRYSNFKKMLPPAHCPRCQVRLELRHRIPLVSWIRQGGRCHRCRAKIPGRQPVVEILTAVLFMLAALRFGPTYLYLVAIFLMTIFVIGSVIDWRYQIIPDELNVLGLIGAAVFCSITPVLLHVGLIDDVALLGWIGENHGIHYADITPTRGLLGLLAGAVPLLIFAEVGGMFAGTDAMGGGDIKLMAWVGPFLGPTGTLVSLFFAAMIAAPCGMIMIMLGKGRREGGFTKFAFGPYLCMGAGLVFYFGSERMAMAYMEFNERMTYLLEPILRPLVSNLL